MVALYETLWNDKQIGYFKQVSRRLKPKLKLYLAQIKSDIQYFASPTIISERKYVRVNRLKVCSLDFSYRA